MHTFREQFKEVLKKYLSENCGIKNVVTLTSWEEYSESGGYCDTCYYESTKFRITYTTTEGTIENYEYYGSFAELLESLLSLET
jgi:hypothetical protein